MTDKTKPPHESFTRRRILGGAAAGGAAMATGAWAGSGWFKGAGEGKLLMPSTEAMLPPNVRKRLAEGAPSVTASIGDIEHVVLLMMENRSFDHYFGAMSGVIGFSDPNAMTLSTGRSVFHQPTDRNADGYLLPFHLDTATTSAQQMASTGHSWRTLHTCWNEGAMDSFLRAHYLYDGRDERVPFVMGYYDQRDIPFHYALADAFTVCDRYHCSMMGPTGPNRTIWESGSIDPSGSAGGPLIANEAFVRNWRTYAEELTLADVGWKHYQVAGGMKSSTRYHTGFLNAQPGTPLAENTKQVGVDRFRVDCERGLLRKVSWLFPGPGQNEHPADSTPAAGAKFIWDTLDAIASRPDIWASTVFILVYDENDGFFDHVPPPTPPAGTQNEFVYGESPGGYNGFGWPIGAGFRVPCVVVSPWTAGGWVCSEPFDHTSCLQFLEAVTGVPAHITPWRRQTFGDFTSALRFQSSAPAPVMSQLPDAAAALTLAQQQIANNPPPVAPTSNQVPPVQNPGTRPTVP